MGKIMCCPFQNSRSRWGGGVHELITSQAGDGTWGVVVVLYFGICLKFSTRKNFFLKYSSKYQAVAMQFLKGEPLLPSRSYPPLPLPKKGRKKDEGRGKEGKRKRKWEERVEGSEGRKEKKKHTHTHSTIVFKTLSIKLTAGKKE